MAWPCNIIVIGASLGNLDAVCKLCGSLPADFPAAILIALDTAPRNPRLFAEIMRRCAPLKVSYAHAGEEILPGHIYVAPPNRQLIVNDDNCLDLEDESRVGHSFEAADRLFASAADVYGSRTIGIVLTGGNEGTEGLRAVKAVGGLTLVQRARAEAEPRAQLSARLRAMVDYCMPLGDIGSFLGTLVEEMPARMTH